MRPTVIYKSACRFFLWKRSAVFEISVGHSFCEPISMTQHVCVCACACACVCFCVCVLCIYYIYDWSAQLVLGCLCLNMGDPQTQWIIGWLLIIMDIHGLSFLSFWKLPCGRIPHFQENPNPRSNIPSDSRAKPLPASAAREPTWRRSASYTSTSLVNWIKRYFLRIYHSGGS